MSGPANISGESQKMNPQENTHESSGEIGDWNPESVPPPALPFSLEEAMDTPENARIFHQATLGWIKERVAEVEAILLDYDAFDFIANFTLREMGRDPETYTEPTHDGIAAIVEYVALLFLKHPYNHAKKMVIEPKVLPEVRERLSQIIASLQFAHSMLGPLLAQTEQEKALETLSYRAFAQETLVRSPGYHHHEKQNLTALFAPFAKWMETSLGFGLDDIFRVEEAFSKIAIAGFWNRINEATQQKDQMLAQVEALRNSPNSGVMNSDEDTISMLAALSPEEAEKRLTVSCWSWVTNYLGTGAFVVTPEEIVAETGLNRERVDAVLRFFALEFGSVDADWYLLEPTHPLKSRPFLHHEESYLYPLPGTLLWSVRERLEAALNPASPQAVNTDKDIWGKYDAHRGEFLEKEALRLFQLALPNAQVYHQLEYEVVEKGQRKQVELDGLVLFDTTLFLIEAKANAFTPRARRGFKDRIARNFKDIFGVSHAQALRAKAYIETAKYPIFWVGPNRKKVKIDRSRITRIITVSVSLDPLEAYTALMPKLLQAGVLAEGELPWAVSLGVLRVICEMNEFPTQLVHYLLRRLEVNGLGSVEALDELDLFGYYLEKGLYFEGDPAVREIPPEVVAEIGEEAAQEMAKYKLITSHSAGFDDYYSYETGERETPADKPVQPMPPGLRELILGLEKLHPSTGYSEAILRLLNWGEDSREDIIKGWAELRQMTLRDGNRHDFTMVSLEKVGLTLFSCLSHDLEETVERMTTYIQMKKYQQKADEWLGLVTLADDPQMVHALAVESGPWKQDNRYDQMIANFFDLSRQPRTPSWPRSRPD